MGYDRGYYESSYNYYNPAFHFCKYILYNQFINKGADRYDCEKIDHAAKNSGGRDVVRYVLRRRQPDLPRPSRPAGGPERHPRHHRLYRHCRRHPHLRRGRHRHHALRWAADALKQGRQGLRHFLHLSSASDHRPAVRHPQMRDRLFHDRRGAHAARPVQRVACAAHFLGHFLRVRPVLLAPPRQDHGLDRQDHQPHLPSLPRRARDRCAHQPRRLDRRGRACGGLRDRDQFLLFLLY